MGFTGPNDEPLICGGETDISQHPKECFTYKDNKWIVASTMTEPRRTFAGCKAPKNGLFVSGGNLYFHLNRCVRLLLVQVC